MSTSSVRDKVVDKTLELEEPGHRGIHRFADMPVVTPRQRKQADAMKRKGRKPVPKPIVTKRTRTQRSVRAEQAASRGY